MQIRCLVAYDPASAGQRLVWEKSLAMQSHGALIPFFTGTDWGEGWRESANVTLIYFCLFAFWCSLFWTAVEGKSVSFLTFLSDHAGSKQTNKKIPLFLTWLQKFVLKIMLPKEAWRGANKKTSRYAANQRELISSFFFGETASSQSFIWQKVNSLTNCHKFKNNGMLVKLSSRAS